MVDSEVNALPLAKFMAPKSVSEQPPHTGLFLVNSSPDNWIRGMTLS